MEIGENNKKNSKIKQKSFKKLYLLIYLIFLIFLSIATYLTLKKKVPQEKYISGDLTDLFSK
jgi:hypothetical protein